MRDQWGKTHMKPFSKWDVNVNYIHTNLHDKYSINYLSVTSIKSWMTISNDNITTSLKHILLIAFLLIHYFWQQKRENVSLFGVNVEKCWKET